jgi:hypothetical protein
MENSNYAYSHTKVLLPWWEINDFVRVKNAIVAKLKGKNDIMKKMKRWNIYRCSNILNILRAV